MNQFNKFIKRYYAVTASIIVFIIYLITVAPTVVQIDSGELAAVQALLGIAHPTGYPLFTLIGYLFVHLPMPFSIIFMSNLLAAIFCSIGIGIFVATSKMILDNSLLSEKTEPVSTSKKNKKQKISLQEKSITDPLHETKKIIAVLSAGLLLGLSKTFWFQSTSVEVYSLHILLINLVIYFLLKAFLQEEKDTKSWLIFSVTLAFSFANHMTSILILPSTAYLFFLKNRINMQSIKKLGLMLLVFFPILFLFYSYLPIRASQNPVINWGNPIDLERILRHISGKQYQVWLFTSVEAAKKQLGYFFSNLPSEFAIAGMLFWIIGIFVAFRKTKRIFTFILITFISTVLYSINYDIHDIDAYFLLANVSLSYFAVFGFIKILDFFTIKKEPIAISVAIILIFLVLQFYVNIGEVNQSKVYVFEDYCKSVLNSTEKNSIIFSYQWDFLISESYYFQNVENFRKDVTVVDKELLRRSWYYNQLEKKNPELVKKLQPDLSIFLNALKPFERDENYDPNILEVSYRNVMRRIVTENSDRSTVYIGPELFENEMQKGEFALPNGYFLVPDLFLFKVVKTTEYYPSADPDFKIRFLEGKNYYYTFIENTIGSMLVRRAMYEMKFDKVERARIYINKIKKDLPNYRIPVELSNAFR
jgi:hypothetical protein